MLDTQSNAKISWTMEVGSFVNKEDGIEVPEKEQKPIWLQTLLHYLVKKDDPAVATDPEILAGLAIFIKEQVPKKKQKKTVKWVEDVDVLRCKPGPLKSYTEYDPMVAGI